MSQSLGNENARLTRDILNEIKWELGLSAGDVSITVDDGIATLRGRVPFFYEKVAAEKSAERVVGVRGVADELDVTHLNRAYERSDQELTDAALDALEWNFRAPRGIKVSVDRAWVTLRGGAISEAMRSAAGDAVSALVGVRGVTNEIHLIRG